MGRNRQQLNENASGLKPCSITVIDLLATTCTISTYTFNVALYFDKISNHHSLGCLEIEL